MNVLLSIKPKHAESIINGHKTYEFRKVIFRNKYVDVAYVYATSPVKKIVGAFRVGNIIEDNPMILWRRLNEFSGMDEAEFFNYFKNNKTGFAIEIRDVKKFEDPLDPNEVIPGFVPPQSFRYVNSSLIFEDGNGNSKSRRIQDY